ncbi:MAG: SUMF1/EgtB/PvdO family nonheme iron enzyme [bacterium]
MNRLFLLPFVLLLMIFLFQQSEAQILGEMAFEEVPAMGAIPDDPSVSLLIVESSVPHLGFSSRKGIRTVKVISASLYYIVLDPGVDYITITADGYLPLELSRMNFPIKSAKKIKVTPLRVAEGEGTLAISSNPSGATITLNDIPINLKTPATLPNQKSGGYRIHLSSVSGFSEVDTTVVVRKGETSRLSVTLLKLVAGLTVISDPSGAMVIWNGDELGTTPLTRDDLKPSEGILTFLMDRYAPVNLGVRLIAGETYRQEVTLVRERGTIEVTTQPSAEVFLDGVSKGEVLTGNLTLRGIDTGEYTVSASLEGYDDASSQVTVEADRTTSVTIKPVPRPGSIYVTASRTGAAVILDGSATNIKTPGKLEGVVAGLHRVTVQLPGYSAETQAVAVTPGSVATANFELSESSAEKAGDFQLPEGLLEANYIEPTLTEIARLEQVIADKQKELPNRIEREVQILRQTDSGFAGRDPFETDAEYQARLQRASQKEADLRKKVESEIVVDEKRQLELLKQRKFITRDIELELNVEDYDANKGEWPLIIKRGKKLAHSALAIGGDQARKLYQNHATLRVFGELAIEGNSTVLQAVVLEEPISKFSGRLTEFTSIIAGPPPGSIITGPLPHMELISIPGGNFMLGSPDTEKDRNEAEGPQHRVTLSPYCMMTTEVTQAQWEMVMGSNPSLFKGPNRPVEWVSWNDVQEFLKKLNLLDPGRGYRLPTEAEWEFAARAGATTRFSWGDDPDYTEINKYAWYKDNSGHQTHDVGTKQANLWGIYDLHGNVWEWCLDLIDVYQDEAALNPIGPASGNSHVLRGGSWSLSGWRCRSASRIGYDTNGRTQSIGFRVVYSSTGDGTNNDQRSQRESTRNGLLVTKSSPSQSNMGNAADENATDAATGEGSLEDMKFIKIPGGIFQMGSATNDKDGKSNEKPQHLVTISKEFEIMTTEVTQSQWVAVMGSNPSRFVGEDRPVETVSWDDVQEFISRMNQHDPGKDYRLPTEVEWEFAARAGTLTRFPWGNDNSYDQLGDFCWYKENSNEQTHDVEKKLPNRLGLYDMSGNVWEWCSDWYGSYSGQDATNPTGPAVGTYIVLKGGSWANLSDHCRPAARSWNYREIRYSNVGFRLVRSVQNP